MHHQLQVRGLHVTPDSSEKVHLSTISGATTDSVACCVMLHGAHETLVGTACTLQKWGNQVNAFTWYYEKGVNPAKR